MNTTTNATARRRAGCARSGTSAGRNIRCYSCTGSASATSNISTTGAASRANCSGTAPRSTTGTSRRGARSRTTPEAIRAKILEIQTETGCEKVNIIAHSKGGLDARYLITRLGMGETVASLTTISTHRGSELLDLLGKLPDGLYRKICGMVDAAFRKVGGPGPDACTASRQLAPAFSGGLQRRNARRPAASATGAGPPS